MIGHFFGVGSRALEWGGRDEVNEWTSIHDEFVVLIDGELVTRVPSEDMIHSSTSELRIV